jgi:PAS domain S-box-containing protein
LRIVKQNIEFSNKGSPQLTNEYNNTQQLDTMTIQRDNRNPYTLETRGAHELSYDELLDRYESLRRQHEFVVRDRDNGVEMIEFLIHQILHFEKAPTSHFETLPDNSPFRRLTHLIETFNEVFAGTYSYLMQANESLQQMNQHYWQEISSQKANLRAILDNFDNAIWFVDQNLNLLDYNRTYSEICRKVYRKEIRVGDHVFDNIKDPELMAKWRERFSEAMKGYNQHHIDHVDLSGTEAYTEFKLFPIERNGQIIGVSVFANDLTKAKKQELQLQKKNEELQKANQELDLFAYSVSHDLRAPLTRILGLISLMEIEKSPENMGQLIHLQRKSVEKLDSFICDILHLSRNARQEVKQEKVDWKEVIEESFESHQSAGQLCKMEHFYQIQDGDIPFFSDIHRIKIILNNLISNAIRYSKPDLRKSFVKVNVQADSKEAIISIEDKGIGIKKEHLTRIFEMFYRATDENNGSGLGLYIAKESARKLGGSIEVQSVFGEGSTFTVRIPNQGGKQIMPN